MSPESNAYRVAFRPVPFDVRSPGWSAPWCQSKLHSAQRPSPAGLQKIVEGMEAMGKLLHHINKLSALLAGMALMFVALSITYSVLIRSAGGCSPIWVTQVNEYAMVWITFLAAAWLLPGDQHVSVELLVARLGPRGKAVCRFGGDIVGTLLCGALCYLGTLCTWENFRNGVIDVQSIDVPKAYILVVIPYGFLLLFLGFLHKAWKDWGQLSTTSESKQISSKRTE